MQTVSEQFKRLSSGSVRPLSWQLRMSFTKQFDSAVTFFTLNQSMLDGLDVLRPSDDNVLQEWDYYNYSSFSERVQLIEYSREIDFPYSVTSSIADFTLNNYDNYFTPRAGSLIEDYILPKRPLRILTGFAGENIPQFVGLTQGMPVIDDKTKTAQFNALDFLSQIFTIPIRNTIAMRDARTNDVLVEIFRQIGVTPDQYVLPRGSNVIRFLFFPEGTTAGTIIRQLMQAEMGNLWLDELGIIRFTPRSAQASIEDTLTLDASNVVDIRTVGDDNIINKVVINANLREVQAFQSIHSKTVNTNDLFVIGAGESRVYEASLEDPIISAVQPTQGRNSSVSWYIATDENGNVLPSNVIVTAVEILASSYRVTFQNNNSVSANIEEMEIWGEPARVVDTIEYTEVNQESIDKYDEQVLTISNDFVTSITQCDSIALSVLREFAEYANQIEIVLKGTPAIQLDDVVNLSYKNYTGYYRIKKISNRYSNGQFQQTIVARKYNPVMFFVLDDSQLNGTHVLAP